MLVENDEPVKTWKFRWIFNYMFFFSVMSLVIYFRWDELAIALYALYPIPIAVVPATIHFILYKCKIVNPPFYDEEFSQLHTRLYDLGLLIAFINLLATTFIYCPSTWISTELALHIAAVLTISSCLHELLETIFLKIKDYKLF